MASYEILIADDHPLFRSALHQALTLGLGPDVRLVEAASIAELEARLNEKADWIWSCWTSTCRGPMASPAWCCCAGNTRRCRW